MTSFTDASKRYEVTFTSCTCPDYQYRQAKQHGQCKHMREMVAETNRASAFLDLKRRFDCRENGDEETRRCYYEMSIAC